MDAPDSLKGKGFYSVIPIQRSFVTGHSSFVTGHLSFVIDAMGDLPETPAHPALTLTFSHREREPEMPESPSPWGEGLG